MKPGDRVTLSAEGLRQMRTSNTWRGTLLPRTKYTWDDCSRVKWDHEREVRANILTQYIEQVTDVERSGVSNRGGPVEGTEREMEEGLGRLRSVSEFSGSARPAPQRERTTR